MNKKSNLGKTLSLSLLFALAIGLAACDGNGTGWHGLGGNPTPTTTPLVDVNLLIDEGDTTITTDQAVGAPVWVALSRTDGGEKYYLLQDANQFSGLEVGGTDLRGERIPKQRYQVVLFAAQDLGDKLPTDEQINNAKVLGISQVFELQRRIHIYPGTWYDDPNVAGHRTLPNNRPDEVKNWNWSQWQNNQWQYHAVISRIDGGSTAWVDCQHTIDDNGKFDISEPANCNVHVDSYKPVQYAVNNCDVLEVEYAGEKLWLHLCGTKNPFSVSANENDLNQ